METKGYLEEIDIQQYWLVLKRRWLIAATVFCASVGLSGLVVLRQKPQYEASGMLLFKSDRTSSLTKVGEKIGDLESLMREGNPLQTQAVIVNSQPILQEVINNLNLKDKDGKPVDVELFKVLVEPVVGTDVIKVSYQSNNPEMTAEVVNQVMNTYIKNNIQSNRTQVFAAGDFIRKRLPSSRAELERATEALRRFKIQNNIVQLPQEATAAITNISNLNEQVSQNQAALADIIAQETELKKQLNLVGEEAVNITSLSQIPGVQEVLGEQQKVQAKLATLKARYTDEHPAIADLKSQELALNSLVKQRVEQSLGSGKIGSTKNISPTNLQIGKIKEDLASQYVQLLAQRQGLEKKVQTLLNIREGYQRKLSILPNLDKLQTDLERKFNIAQTDYQNLVARLQEIEIVEKQTIGNARVVQPALVPKIAAMSKMTLLLLGGGVFVGLLVGIASAFFIDLIDRSLKTVKESEKFFGYTMLGFIPKFEPNNTHSSLHQIMGDNVSPRVIVASSPRTVIHEAYQMLQANLKFISHKKVCTIVVTSSVAGEGKSEVTANLAAIIAQSGRRVLLVDADMRQPSQHHLWGLINSSGLSNIIVGQDEFSLAVKTVTNHLSILTAGVQPPNPSALIDSEGMLSLIEKISENYDYIIFDTPPLVGTADAAVLGKMVDGVLLVARPKVVDSVSAQAAKSLLERSEANVLGIIANAVNLKQEPDSYFHYSDSRIKHSVAEIESAGGKLAPKSFSK
ncbi:GumC family protein [Brunnivagina elsteri]|uniref:non-specific protein-tyrosine kinase n=1 Tax=Brunnivagina elsteri CCALA 953 TaxID=987040 RepID=A0A2A2TC28_9CYAN|nr:polysaccharide biosynthesis tyrosine autokinase [Calothrix elsteri]PAX51347.1 lipopolysaccharide biosynthesis protein [Calothrix elsteri CCALA 953]